ncbi:hypothetical protein ThrDRAFT_02787 [Frankia casuarinae]|nr:hypothetical protein ThrDRAFT_02787 [Frankia casuarinae]
MLAAPASGRAGSTAGQAEGADRSGGSRERAEGAPDERVRRAAQRAVQMAELTREKSTWPRVTRTAGLNTE